VSIGSGGLSSLYSAAPTLLCHRQLLHLKVWERHPEAAKEVIRQPLGVVAMRIARGSREGLPVVVKRRCCVLQCTHCEYSCQ
jgi:hypothetical protein